MIPQQILCLLRHHSHRESQFLEGPTKVNSAAQRRGFMDRRRMDGWETSVHRKDPIIIGTKARMGDGEFAQARQSKKGEVMYWHAE
jgi:hypothetical protein